MIRRHIVRQSQVCANCRCKFGAARERCPRCATLVVTADATPQLEHGPWLARCAGTLMAAALLGLAAIYLPGAWTAATSGTKGSHERGTSREAARPAEPAFVHATAPVQDPASSLTAQYEAAVRRHPNDAGSVSSLAQVLARTGRLDEARPHFRRAIELEPASPAHYVAFARALAVERRWNEAITELRRAQELAPDDFAIAFAMATTLHESGNHAAAVEQYKAAMALSPGDASTRMGLGVCYEALDRPQQAAQAFDDYLRLAPSAPDAERIRRRVAALTGRRSTDESRAAGS